MESMIIKTETAREGGSDWRASIGYGGCLEITEQLRGANDHMGKETVEIRIPKEQREQLGNFILNAK